MFTLEDLDLTEELDYIREHASQFLPAGGSDEGTDPAADATRRPGDYLIVR